MKKPKIEKGTEVRGAPRVFVSSTAQDLRAHREAVRDAALRVGLLPVMHEYWEAKDVPPYTECMARVDDCQVLVAVVAHRYGFEPPDQPLAAGEEAKSITWLECERAASRGIKVLPFLLDDQADWPADRRDGAELAVALEKHGASSTEFTATALRVERSGKRLAAFKSWLQQDRIRRLFGDPNSLGREVEAALRTWREEHAPRLAAPADPQPDSDFVRADYLAWILRHCGTVDLLGLDSRTVRAPSLSNVYVPAVTLARARLEPEIDATAMAQERPDRPAHEMLVARLADASLFVEGAAGGGKSTFCRWVAWLVANQSMPPIAATVPDAYREVFPEPLAAHTPVLLILRDIVEDLRGAVGQRQWTAHELLAALTAWADRTRPGDGHLSGSALRELITAGRALLIFDGVDELPTSDGPENARHHPRDLLLSGLADARAAWTNQGNRILVTCRPDILVSSETDRLGLDRAPIAAMPEELQALFVKRWFAATDPDHGDSRAAGLLSDVGSRPELRELSGNPILLTALCICYSDGERLPEDQFLLYDRVVKGVLAHRFRDEQRDIPRIRRRLSAIALGMHEGSQASAPRETPSAEVSQAEAERVLDKLAETSPATETSPEDSAHKLGELLAKSGLLVGRSGKKAAFHHLSFQEFLAAEELIKIHRQDPVLLGEVRRRSPTPEWRRTLVHLFGALALRHRDEQWAVERLTELLREQSREGVREQPAPALVLADCIDMALGKGCFLGDLKQQFTQLCLNAIEDEIELHARARLALSLGRLGDPRPGVGVGEDGLPELAWVDVPGGPVEVEGRPREKVVGFRIAKYPITNAQFDVFLDAEDGHRSAAWWDGLERPEPVRFRISEPNAPRMGISWFEAVAFCRWLTARTGIAIRLPSEAEWQLAATGGDPRRAYPWGDWREGMCNSKEAELQRTCAVGIFPRATWDGGPLDLAGNVWEWCSDEDPEFSRLFGSSSRVYRGGSWIAPAVRCRSASRSHWHPVDRLDSLGFRPASSSLA